MPRATVSKVSLALSHAVLRLSWVARPEMPYSARDSVLS